MTTTGSSAAADGFRKRFKSDPAAVAFAPGRVNIIGEHTDYNDGFVLPCAVDLATFIAFKPRDDGLVRIYSRMVDEEVTFEIAKNAGEGLPFWALYAWGTGMSLSERGVKVTGFDACAHSTVPQGGGLSSSASFEVASAICYMGKRWTRIAKIDLAHACRRAENAYVGTNCGIMDQFSSIFGKENHAVMLDCRSLDFRHVPVPVSAALVVSDTGVRHVLGESGYHRRQEECKAATAMMAEMEKGVKNLRDVTVAMLDRRAGVMGDLLYRRARHVVTENARVRQAADALEAGDLRQLGVLMSESHDSLKNNFEVSCRELDIMVESAQGIKGGFGSRMVGGGFGGCAVSLVDRDEADRFARSIAARYEKSTGIAAKCSIVHPGPGAGLIEL